MVEGAGIASAGGGAVGEGAGLFASAGIAAGARSSALAGVASVAGVGNAACVAIGADAPGARSVSGDGIVSLISTGVPAPIADATCNTLQLVRRMQPWDWVLEMREGSGVPWMPTCGFDRLIHATPTGLFGPGWIVALESRWLPSQNSAGL